MTLEEILSQGFKFCTEKNFDAALKVASEVQRLDPTYRRGYYLEAAVWHGLNNPFKEYYALKKILPLLNFSAPEEKNFASEILRHLGPICRNLGLWKEYVDLNLLLIKIDTDQKCFENLSSTFFVTNAVEKFSAADFQMFCDELEETLAYIKPYPRKFYNHKKIRVGFLSSDFRDHAVIIQSWTLLTKLDKNLFETFCYSNLKKGDNVTDKLRSIVDGWRDIFDLSDEEAAKIIREDEIDILFDLNGHTAGNRLRVAAYHPASVQMSGIGYMGSTGLKCFDYFLSDETCAGDESFFTEKVIKLPHSHFCHYPSTQLEPAKNPPCVKNNFVTFGSFNKLGKMTDSILKAWKKILDAVPESRLILKTKIFDTEDGKNFAGERLKNLGFDLSRVEMRPTSATWLTEYGDVDIALDTFPYTGGMTTCEALYMGVPVISLYGKRHGSRTGLGILKNIGLEEFAVDSLDEYVNRAVALANDWKLLKLLRKNLRPLMRQSPLMNSELYLSEIQAAFVKILEESKKFLEEKKILDINELYLQAEEMHKVQNYDAELKIIEEIHRLDPTHKRSYYMEAWMWENLGNLDKEYHALKKILPLLNFSAPEEKDFASEVLNNLGGICDEKLFLWQESVQAYLLCMKMNDKKKRSGSFLSRVIFMANAAENFSAEEFRALYDDYEKTLADIVPYPKKFYNHKKIRVGFLSADFCKHTVITWSWSLFTKLDKKFFETYFYFAGKESDVVTEHLRAAADGWRDISDLSDEEAAKIIRDDEIDILFDLSGHTRHNRLRIAAYRPASVQMSGIGYMGSTGLKCFDYFLSDETCAGDESFFTEKVIKLPHSHICYEPPTKFEPSENPPCLKNNFITFGSFNNFGKVTDSVLIAWKKILDAVPKSRLLLKAQIFNTEYGKNFAGERLKNLGFDLSRVEMRNYAPNWFMEYADVDIAPDTFPYTGGVTTCEALFMGVPVVSLYGKRHGSRFGLSILKNIGLEELAVDSLDEYIKRTIALANDWELLKILRKNLRAMMKKSPLMNSELYISEIQSAFKKILNDERQKS